MFKITEQNESNMDNTEWGVGVPPFDFSLLKENIKTP